jgi:hypothetical protein
VWTDREVAKDEGNARIELTVEELGQEDGSAIDLNTTTASATVSPDKGRGRAVTDTNEPGAFTDTPGGSTKRRRSTRKDEA